MTAEQEMTNAGFVPTVPGVDPDLTGYVRMVASVADVGPSLAEEVYVAAHPSPVTDNDVAALADERWQEWARIAIPTHAVPAMYRDDRISPDPVTFPAGVYWRDAHPSTETA